MSAYANIARALGAEVRGWDVRDTIFMGSLDGHRGRPRRRADAARRAGRSIVSTAHLHRIDGTPRADVPRRARRRAAGDRRRRRPRQDDDGGDDRVRPRARPAATRPGSSAASSRSSAATPASARGWLVVEGDESDRSIGALRAADRGDHEHRARPPRDLRVRGGAARVLRRLARDRPAGRAQLGARRRSSSSSPCPAITTARTPPPRSPRSSSQACRAPRPRRRSCGSPGVGRRFELVGERGGVTVYDDYGHNPTELEVTLRTARSLTERQADRRLPAARRRAHAAAAPRARRGARARRRGDRDGHHRRPRRAARRASPGKLVVDSLPPRRAGRLGAVARRRRRARARLGAARRPRDHVRRGGAVEDRARDRRRAAGDAPQRRPSGRTSRSRG